MTIEEAIDSVNLYFKTAWDAASTGIALTYNETPINNIPADNAPTKEVTPMVIVATDIIDSSQVTLGAKPNRRFRRNGLMIIRIMTPQRQGRLKEDQFAKIVYDSLEGECTPEGVELFKISPLAGFTAGAYYVKQYNVDFEFDEIK